MLFNWDASGIQKSFSEHVFEAFANGICVLAVQNMVPELARIGSILSVCVFNFLQADVWTDFEQKPIVIS